MKELELSRKESVNLTPTGLERNLPIIGIAKYALRTRKNLKEDSREERAKQIEDIEYRQYGITASLGSLGIIASILLNYQ